MSVTIALVPVVTLLALVMLYLLFAGLRSSRIAELKSEHDHFTQNVIQQDASLQKSLLDELLGGRSPADSLSTFERRRAALLPGARLEDSAGWDADELTQFARRQFGERLAEVNRKLGVRALTAAVVIIAACVILCAVLYNFQAGAVNPLPASASDIGLPSDLPNSLLPLPPDPSQPGETVSPSSAVPDGKGPDSKNTAVTPNTPPVVSHSSPTT